MIKIIKAVVGDLDTNCYILYDNKNREAVIVDPGGDGELIKDTIGKFGLNPKLIIATHGHNDHISDVFDIKTAYNIPFAISYKDLFLLRKYYPAIFGGYKPEVDLNSCKKIRLTDFEIGVIKTPGHTPGSVSLFVKKVGIMCGDLIFDDGNIGRYDLWYSDYKKIKNSINKILKYDEETKIYSGHQGEFCLLQFKKMNSIFT